MKLAACLATGALALFAAQTAALAQLPAGNATGVATGHMHLAMTDVEKGRALFRDLGAVEVSSGRLSMLRFPGVYILIAERAPTGPSAGSSADHLGFAVKDLAAYKQKLLDHGAKIAVENAELGLVLAELSEGTRIELRREEDLANPIEFHHVHLAVADPDALAAWYVDVFGAEASTRMNLPSAVVPGGRVDFLKATGAPAPTQGRAIDHIGFEIDDMEAFAARLRAKGVKFDREPAAIEAIGLTIAFITDPAGTYIELTQGLRGK
jgi:catechol 2,3-dioxygenase-like lactoylglutathione lyase family enzyme